MPICSHSFIAWVLLYKTVLYRVNWINELLGLSKPRKYVPSKYYQELQQKVRLNLQTKRITDLLLITSSRKNDLVQEFLVNYSWTSCVNNIVTCIQTNFRFFGELCFF